VVDEVILDPAGQPEALRVRVGGFRGRDLVLMVEDVVEIVPEERVISVRSLPDAHGPERARSHGRVQGPLVAPPLGVGGAAKTRSAPTALRTARPDSRVMPAPMSERRYVVVSTRTIGIAIGGFILAASALVLVYEARRVLTWVLIATFLALALNRIVAFLERWLPRTAAAVMTFALALAAVSGVGYLVVPVLVDQAAQLVNQIPDLIQRLSEGGGPLGFLDSTSSRGRKNSSAEDSVNGPWGSAVRSHRPPKGALTTVIGVFAIAFLTLFLLVRGPRWREALIAAAPEEQQLLWKRMSDGYRSVGGWVLGAIILGAIAGGSATLVLLALGVPYAVALGVVVGALDPIPFVGATLAGAMCVGPSSSQRKASCRP
jgi:predicted PurR-regulated permease PerM